MHNLHYRDQVYNTLFSHGLTPKDCRVLADTIDRWVKTRIDFNSLQLACYNKNLESLRALNLNVLDADYSTGLGE